MKKALLAATSMILIAASISGCFGQGKWYQSVIDYYGDGFALNWENEGQLKNTVIGSEQKDPTIKFGYNIIDLDGDGTDEILIGIIDGSNQTKITDVYVNRGDLGAYDVLHGSEGDYIYLCTGNILRVDSSYGNTTESEFLKYNSKDYSFTVVDGNMAAPKTVELTPFE
ncbi:MAG: hypothetical protein IKE53_09700 [Clostridiales bacterium]|nr:hypothetical protein [Clostridiales bacterium]